MGEVGLSIVVPVYNGAKTVPLLVQEVEKLNAHAGHELILVNDGSADDSAAVCSQLAESAKIPITFIDLARNFGEHNAVMAGIRHARGEYIINIDDDLQNPPNEVIRLYDFAREGKYDVVYTSFGNKKHAGWRNLGSWLTNKVSDYLLDKPKGLYLSSFRCMSAFVAQQICAYEGAFPYIDGMILQVTQRIGQLEVEHKERAGGESGYTLARLIKLWTNMFVNFSIIPLRISTALGLLIGSLGFLGALLVIVEHFFLDNPPGWGMLMCTLFVFCGAQLLILGIAGEYLGRMYLNANRRPQFIVRAIVRGHQAAS